MAKTLFSDGNPLQGILGTIVNAAWLNKVFLHRHDGLDQDGSAPLDYAADQGAANVCVVALVPALTAHITGLPIRVKVAATNTGATTLAVNGLAPVSVKHKNGAALTAGDLRSGGLYQFTYDGAAYQLESDVFESVTAGDYGYQKLPGGIIIQWGRFQANGTAGSPSAVSFPITFPNSVGSLVVSANYTSPTPAVAWHDTLTTSGFNLRCSVNTGDYCRYMAIGR